MACSFRETVLPRVLARGNRFPLSGSASLIGAAGRPRDRGGLRSGCSRLCR